MRRLTATDSRWLDLENARRPMHTLKIAVLKPQPGIGIAELRESLRARVKGVPTMQWRLGFGPRQIGRPCWVEGEDFELDQHLVRKRIAGPGSRRELCAMVARAAEAPLLDRSRPLWQLSAVEGLEQGRMAVIARVHHAFADGVSFARILASWFAPGTLPAVEPPGAGLGTVEHLTRMGTVGLREEVAAIAAFLRATRGAERPATAETPRTPFSGRALSPRRAFACQALSLARVHAARKPLGATVNDLLIALVAASLRAYLKERRALPSTPLVATMPVSLLDADEREPIGNRGLTATKMCLPTDVDDPLETVGAAQAYARAAKDELAATRGARLDDAVDLLPRFAVRGAARALDSAHGPDLGNLSLSNVRGPSETLTADGFLLEDFFSVGPCMPGVGLNITAWSYADRFHVAALTDAELIEDPWDVVARMPSELDRITQAIEPAHRTQPSL